MKYWSLLIILLMSLSCNGPPPPPECPDGMVWNGEECVCPDGQEEVEILGGCWPLRVDRPINLRKNHYGITAFSLTIRKKEYVQDFVKHAKKKDVDILRCGAQTDGWADMQAAASMLGIELSEYSAQRSYLPVGPRHGTKKWEKDLIRMLEITARTKKMWVQLIPTFTHKQRDKGSQEANIAYFNAMFDRVNDIVEEGDYKHVFYEVFNEVVHPLSQHIKDEDVLAMFYHIKAQTDRHVGTDHGGGRAGDFWQGRYPYIWRGISTYIAFHTPRNPEPSLKVMLAGQSKYKYVKPVLVDETVAYASDAIIKKWGLKGKGTIAMMGYGTERERKNQVIKHLRDINALGWQEFYHAVWLIICDEFGWIPKREIIEGELKEASLK